MAEPPHLATARAVPARIAIAVRRAVFTPGGRFEALYQRAIRPWGRKLLPKPPAAQVGRIQLHQSPARLDLQAREILVLKLDHIGDFLLAVPAFAALRRGLPGARITLLCGPWNVAIAEASGFFDRVLPYRFFAAQAEAPRPAPDLAALAALGRFDLAIDLRVDQDTRPLLTAVRATRRAGYAVPRVPLDIELPPPPRVPPASAGLEAHTRQRLLNLVGAVLAHDFAGDTAALLRRYAAPRQARKQARPVVALNTGSGRAIKNWPLDNFIALGRLLRARGATLLLLGGPGQQPHAARIRAALGEDGVIDLVGRLDLDASFGMLADADAYVGNDTALGHAAAVLGLPTIILFSGIDPLPHWAPLGPNALAIKADITCAPCHLSDIALCPNAHQCMTSITVTKVWDSLADRLPWPAPRRQTQPALPATLPS